MSAITSSTSSSTPPAATDAFSAIQSEDFMRIIFAELTNQDPLQPNETQDLLNQISTIQAIESDRAFTDTLGRIEKQNQVTSATSLIGNLATGLNASGNRVVGFVDSISISRDGVTLNLNNGSRLPFENVDEVIDPSLVDGPPEEEPTEDDPIDEPDDPGDDPADDGGDGG